MWESILPAGVADVASILASWPGMREFYLSGGTAMALHHGHRKSRDLDFFTRNVMTLLPDLSGLDTMLATFSEVEWTQRAPDEVRLRLDGVSVTLLAYPFAHDFGFWEWRGLAVAYARDIAVQKAYTVGRRAQARDYLDLYAMFQSGLISLEELMRRAQNIYQDSFSPRLFLQQPTYTRDLPDRDDALSLLKTPQPFETVERKLQEVVRQWAEQHLQYPEGEFQGPSE